MNPSVRVKRNLTTQPSVAVIVPTRGTSAEVFGKQRVLVVEAVRSLFEKSTYQNFQCCRSCRYADTEFCFRFVEADWRRPTADTEL